MIKSLSLVAATLVAVSGVAASQQPPPIRPLGSVVATSSETFGAAQVFTRHLRNGVLVNDVLNRRLVMLDPTLTNVTVVADTTSATANSYSGRVAGLIAYRGDSSLFVDASSMSMLVIDGEGKVARVMSVPRSQDAMVLGSGNFGMPGLDASGRLVYRGMPRFEMRPPPRQAGNNAGAATMFTPPEMPDTAAVVRVDLTSRQLDTVAFTKVPRMKMDVQRDEATGRVSMQAIINPLPLIDDWAVLSDGSIAIVRGRDYHIDWIRPDGTRESSPKIPFEWQRLTDEDKVAFIDSVKAARARIVANNPAPATPAPGAAGGGGPGGGGPGGGGEGRQIIIGGPGEGAGRGAGMGGMGREPVFVQPQELPDYKPPFFAGSARPDRDGHLWIRTIPTKGIPGGPVYDVIDTKGQLVDRVQVPKDRVIVGFGDGGVVYLLATDGSTRKLERASYK